MSSILGTSA